MKTLLILFAVASLVACGGGGDGAAQLSLSAPGEADLDGWVRSDGDVVTVEGGPITGDYDSINPNVGLRQFFSFDLSALPAGASVVSATLRIFQSGTSGTPYVTHGSVLVDHMAYGGSLVAGHYDDVPLAALGVFSSDPTAEYKTIDVTASVQADLEAARARSQYRLRFSDMDSDNDGTRDYASFVDTENSCCAEVTPPSIEIVYTMP